MKIEHNHSLAQHTTFQIGGPARAYVACTTETELKEALTYAQTEQLPLCVLSGGSNVLIADEGFKGLVVHILTKKTLRMGNTVTAAAGVTLLDLIRQCHDYGLGGWESLAGIPGSVGGAIRGNVGAFGSEILSFVTSVRALHRVTLEEKTFSQDECEFSYRSSWFKENPEWIVLDATFSLQLMDARTGAEKANATIAERERRHLQNIPCAGSYFMNPVVPQWVQDEFQREKGVTAREGRVPAGWLIEKAGMKGFSVGNAGSSTMHANYVINKGGATATDVRAVARAIQDKVQKQFTSYLHEEPSMVGFEQEER